MAPDIEARWAAPPESIEHPQLGKFTQGMFQCRIAFFLQDFFTSDVEAGMSIDHECIVVHCGQRAFERGVRLGDQILCLNGVALDSGSQFRDAVCSLYDSLAKSDVATLSVAQVELQVQRKKCPSSRQCESSSTDLSAHTWKSMGPHPNLMGLPSRRLHEVKRLEFQRGLSTVIGATEGTNSSTSDIVLPSTVEERDEVPASPPLEFQEFELYL